MNTVVLPQKERNGTVPQTDALLLSTSEWCMAVVSQSQVIIVVRRSGGSEA